MLFRRRRHGAIRHRLGGEERPLPRAHQRPMVGRAGRGRNPRAEPRWSHDGLAPLHLAARETAADRHPLFHARTHDVIDTAFSERKPVPRFSVKPYKISDLDMSILAS